MGTYIKLPVAESDYQALKNSMNAIMEHLGLDPKNLPAGSYSEIVIGAMQAQTAANGRPFAYVSPAVLKEFQSRSSEEDLSLLIMQVPLACHPLKGRECVPVFLNAQDLIGIRLDRMIDAIARVAYSYAVHLDEATRGADDHELEGIARTSTSNLKAMIRKILTGELP